MLRTHGWAHPRWRLLPSDRLHTGRVPRLIDAVLPAGSLRRLPQPTLVLAGDDDPIVPLANGRILNRLIPDSRLHVMPGGGHLFLLERPAETAALVTDFLTEPRFRSG